MALAIGKRFDAFATRALTPAARWMARGRVRAEVAKATSQAAGWTALSVGYYSWEMGSALRAAAQPVAAVKTEQVITWWMFGFHLNAVTHMALDKLFPSAGSEVSSAGEALMYVGSAWGKAAVYAVLMSAVLLINHESGHYAAAVKGGNLRKAIMEPILEIKNRPLSKRWGWEFRSLTSRVLIPFGKFRGITRPKALDFETDGAAPLNVRAAGPRRDLMLGIPTLLASLVSLIFLSQQVGENSAAIAWMRTVAEYLFPASVASLYGAFRYDNGALIESYQVRKAEEEAIRKGRGAQQEAQFDLTDTVAGIKSGSYGEE